MIRILLCCAGGMSTSLLVTKWNKQHRKKELKTKIWAVGATEVKNHSQDADVILLGPQVRYLEKSIADDANGVPAYLIDMRDYGKMDGKAVLTFALNKLQEV